MKPRIFNKNDLDGKMLKFKTDHKVYCKNSNCNGGHGVVFVNKKIDRKLCPNCGHWIYRDPQTELKYKMKERGVCINEKEN